MNHNSLACHKVYSAQQLTEDFNILVQTLEEAHPDLYRVNPKVKIQQRIKQIESRLTDSLSYLQFLKLVAPLFTEIGCVNTQWGHSKDYIDFRNKNIPIFPLKFEIEKDRFIITKNWSGNSKLSIGDEILALNGESIQNYISKNRDILPIDGKIISIQDRWLESAFPQHHSNFWEQPDSFRLKIKATNGKISTQVIKAQLKAHLKQLKSKTIHDSPLKFSVQDSIALLTIKSFNPNRIKMESSDFRAFFDSTFAELQQRQLPLVIDLRDNSWGSLELGAVLMEYLSTSEFTYLKACDKVSNSSFSFSTHIQIPEKVITADLCSPRRASPLSYIGDLYLITNGWNVNAGGLFSSRIANRPQTYFLHEKPGACTFGINFNSLSLVLPNTQLSVYIPTQQLLIEGSDYHDSFGIPNILPLDHPKIPKGLAL